MIKKDCVKKLLLGLVVSSGIMAVSAVSASASVGNGSLGSAVATANPITVSNQATSDDSSGQLPSIGTLKYKIEGDTLILSGGGMKSEDSLNPSLENGFVAYPWSGEGITKVEITGPVELEGVAPRDLFFDMESLKTFKVVGNGRLDTSKATSMSGMFGVDSKLTELDLSGLNTSNVIDMRDMFLADSALTKLIVSGFDTQKVTDMSGMFGADFALTELAVSSFRTPSVTDMTGMFADDRALTSLDISNFKTPKLNKVAQMFGDDFALTSLDASGLDTSNVDTSNINDSGEVFTGDKNLWQLTLGDKTGNEILSSLEKHSSKSRIPGSDPVRYAAGPGWQAVHPENDTSSGTVTDPKGIMYATRDAFATKRPLEKNTYVWQQTASAVTPVTPSNNGTSGAIVSSSDSTSSSSSAAAATSQVSTSSSDKSAATTTIPDYTVTKGTVVYAIKKVGLYQSADFTSAKRKAWYAEKPRIYRPMFVVTGYKRSENGVLRYQVKDVNHGSKTDGKTGYITANQKYVRPVYYATKHSVVTVINPHGVNAYRKANQTGKVKNYRQGTVLHVKRIVKHNLTTRYVLTNGKYITANRKLVNMGRHRQVKAIKTKRTINRYRNVNLTRRSRTIAKGTTLRVYGYDYSHGNSVSKHGVLRYRVANGYVTANTKYVRAYR